MNAVSSCPNDNEHLLIAQRLHNKDLTVTRLLKDLRTSYRRTGDVQTIVIDQGAHLQEVLGEEISQYLEEQQCKVPNRYDFFTGSYLDHVDETYHTFFLNSEHSSLGDGFGIIRPKMPPGKEYPYHGST